VLYNMVSANGMDTLGAPYIKEAVAMGKRMGIFDSLDHIENKNRRRVYTVTAWAVFNLQR
jgi:NaMN:DMB phosphoribosyltransferase